MAGSNFGGLGFTFFGKDITLAKTLNTVSEGFKTVWEGFKNLAGNSSRMAGRVVSGFGMMAKRGKGLLGGVSGALDNMAQKALSPNIDNALSSTAAQFSKTWGEITVGMNMGGKEAKKWKRTLSSAAYSLNADWGETAKNWAAFRTHNIKLTEAMGKKGMAGAAKALIRYTSTLGIEGKQLALIYSGLTKGFGFTTKRVSQLNDVVFAMGKKFNMGKQVIQGMPGIIDVMNKELAGFTKGMKPEDIEKFTHSIVKMGVGFKEGLGSSAEDALELSKNLFSTLAKETKGVQKMFMGMGDSSFSPIIKALAEKGGVHKAFQMIMSDPAKFMGALRKMTAETEKRGGKMSVGFGRLKKSITTALGANVSFLATGKESWSKASKAMGVLNKMLGNQKSLHGSINKAAKKSYGTALTKGDAYQRMLTGFNIRLKKLSDPMVNKWMKDQKKGFDTIMEKLGGKNGLAKKSGPVGELTRRLLTVQRVGLSGLFTSMKGLGPMLDMVVTKIGPMLSALAAAGVSFMFIGKLLMPGGLILMGLMLFHKGIRDKVLKGLETLWKYVSEKLPKMWPQIKAGLSEMWDRAIKAMNWFKDVVVPMVARLGIAIGRGMQRLWIHASKVLPQMWPQIKTGVTEMWDKAIKATNWLMDVVSPMMIKLAEAISKVNWGALVTKLINYAGKAFRGVFQAIFGGKKATKGVAAGVDKTTDTAADRFSKAGNKLAGAIGTALKVAIKTAGAAAWKLFTDWSMGLEKGLASKGKLLGGIFIVAMLFGGTRRLLLRGLWFLAATMFKVISAMLVKMFAWAASMAAQWGVAFWPVVAVIAVLAALGLAFYALTGKLGPTAQKIAQILTFPFIFLWETVKPLVAGIQDLFAGNWRSFFANMASFTLKMITMPFRLVWGVVKNAVDLVSHLWNMLRDRLGATGRQIMDAISWPFRKWWAVVSGVSSMVGGAMSKLYGFIKGESNQASQVRISDSINAALSATKDYNQIGAAAVNSGNNASRAMNKASTDTATASGQIKARSAEAWRSFGSEAKAAASTAAQSQGLLAKAMGASFDAIAKKAAEMAKQIENLGGAKSFKFTDMAKKDLDQFVKLIPKYRGMMKSALSKSGFVGGTYEASTSKQFKKFFSRLKKSGMTTEQAMQKASVMAIKSTRRKVSASLARGYAHVQSEGATMGGTLYKKARRELMSKMKSGAFAGKGVFDTATALGQMGYRRDQLQRAGMLGAIKKTGGGASTALKFKGAAYKKYTPMKTKGTPGVKAVPQKGFTASEMSARRSQTASRQVSSALSKDTKAAMTDVSTAIAQLTSAIRTFKVVINISGDIGDHLRAKSKQAQIIKRRQVASKTRAGG